MPVKETFSLGSKDFGTDVKHQMIVKTNEQKASETDAEDAKCSYHVGNLVQNTYSFAVLAN